MKSTLIKKTGKASKKNNSKLTFSKLLRSAKRGSGYAFAASLGIWLPRADAATLVNIDATTQALGPLTTWPNTGTVSGDFTSSGSVTPSVVAVDGINAVALTDPANTAGDAVGQQYVGPVAPGSVCTNNQRTVEAWIFDPGPYQNEKTIFAWGRRANPVEFALEHGIDSDLGAINSAGGRGTPNLGNMGWRGQSNVVTNHWTYIVATYDGNTLSVYSDGVLINSEKYVPGFLNTTSVGNDAPTLTPLRFRVARQNLNGGVGTTGTASGTGIGPFYAGRIRVQDTNMTAAQVLAQYNTEKAAFGYTDTDGDGMQDWYEDRFGLNKNSAADAALDPDGDGATNLEESQWGSDPNVADTDGDGINDGAEIHRIDPQTLLAAPTNPTKADTDDDGLSDAVETDNGTTTSDPLKADTDGDTYSDAIEVAKGTNPTSAASAPIPLIALDATVLSAGPLATWTNAGSVLGNFDAVSATNQPSVTNIDGVMGVNFTTVGVGGSGGRNGTSYFGPAVPAAITGAGARTAEMWVFNRTIANEETMLAWGARGGDAADGKNVSFGEGRDPGFGACAQWGTPDIGWNNQEVYGRWVYLAYTYDGTATRIYADGVLVDTETFALITQANSANPADGTPYHFRIARQNQNFAAANVNSGFVTNIDTTGAGEFTLAKVRVHDVALDGASLKARFDAEKAAFGLTDTDGDGMPDWYEIRWGLNKNSAADAALDPDADGATSLQESQQGAKIPNAGTVNLIGTIPTVADTDGDTKLDGAEINRNDPQSGLHAETDALRADTDGDGLSDGVETDTGVFVSASNTGSDPLKGDSDGDAFGDGTEVTFGTDPNNPLSFPTPPPLVSLVTTNLPIGFLANWTNSGSIAGVFTNADGGANVQTNQGVKSVSFTGGYYTGPVAPNTLVSNPTYSVESWIYNPGPTSVDEETIFSWGRRGGNPDGSNASFNHGNSLAYGAMGHWGGPDLGWGDATNVIQGRWTYLVYTYEGASRVQNAYVDGRFVNTETLAAPGLQIANVDNTGTNGLRFRIASQTDANGVASAAFRGTLAIGELRVYGVTLTQSQITTNFNAGALKYGILDQDGDGMPSWFERGFPGCLNENVNDAGNDCDGDGLTNLQEYNAHTDPTNPDTDGDGIPDGTETANGTNPTSTDTDRDFLSDKLETSLGTPLNGSADTDGDGFLDYVEILYGSNPNDINSTPNLSIPKPLINLDATLLPVGALPLWTNNNAFGWNFIASSNALAVSVVDGTKGVTFNGADYYTGPGAPDLITGNAARTVEAWVWNPAIATEETVVAWGRRGGNPDGSNMGFSHGTDPVFGGGQHWASADVPWGTNATEIASNLVAGHWTFIALAYDPGTVQDTLYKDGVAVHTESVTNAAGAPLNTFLFDPSDPYNQVAIPIGRGLPFRVGAQNDANGGASVPFASMTMAKVRVYDQTLTAQQIADHYNAEVVQFPGQPVINHVKVDPNTGIVSFDWVPAPGKSYAVETNSNLAGGWATAASGVTSGGYTNTVAGSPQFYRLRIE